MLRERFDTMVRLERPRLACPALSGRRQGRPVYDGPRRLQTRSSSMTRSFMRRQTAVTLKTVGNLVLPARPAHPRDKSRVEVAVRIAQRWLFARVRDEVFHSLGALNGRLLELLVDLNAREMRRYGKNRRALFEAIERTALRPLPTPMVDVHGEKRIDEMHESTKRLSGGRLSHAMKLAYDCLRKFWHLV